MKIKQVTADRWDFYFDHREVLEQGVNIWYRGCPFPYRGYHDNNMIPNFHLRVLERLGSVKKYLFGIVHLMKLMAPRTFSVKKYHPFIREMINFFNWNLGEYLIKDEMFSVPVWEMGKGIHRFLSFLNLEFAGHLTRVAMMILEFDNAYRWRLQDILSIMGGSTRKDIKTALETYLEREILLKQYDDYGARGKILRMARIILWLMYIPSFKRRVQKAFNIMDLKKVGFTDSDRFHFSHWYGYNFEGKTFEQRFGEYEHIYKMVPYRKRENPNKIIDFMTGHNE